MCPDCRRADWQGRSPFRDISRSIVQIELIEGETEESALAWIAANAVDSDALPADLADQHDHYLYGRPKKDTRG